MSTPDNHFARRADDRRACGYKPTYSPSWLTLLAAIAAWCLLVCGLTYMGLPFLRFLVEHVARAHS